MDDRMQEILQSCLEDLDQGRSMEQCLAQYPEDAALLEPLLQTALSVRGRLPLAVPEAARARLRNRVMAAWDQRQQPRRSILRLPVLAKLLAPRWATVTAAVVLVVALSSVSTVAAAGGAVPGDLLYPVKEFREEAQLWFARSSEAKVEMYTRMVKERAEEVRELATQAEDRSNAITQALDRLDRHLAALDAVMKDKLQREPAAPAVLDSGFLEALGRVADGQDAARVTLEETLDQAPGDIQNNLGASLEAIQQAQERVRAALESAPPAGSGDGR